MSVQKHTCGCICHISLDYPHSDSSDPYPCCCKCVICGRDIATSQMSEHVEEEHGSELAIEDELASEISALKKDASIYLGFGKPALSVLVTYVNGLIKLIDSRYDARAIKTETDAVRNSVENELQELCVKAAEELSVPCDEGQVFSKVLIEVFQIIWRRNWALGKKPIKKEFSSDSSPWEKMMKLLELLDDVLSEKGSAERDEILTMLIETTCETLADKYRPLIGMLPGVIKKLAEELAPLSISISDALSDARRDSVNSEKVTKKFKQRASEVLDAIQICVGLGFTREEAMIFVLHSDVTGVKYTAPKTD